MVSFCALLGSCFLFGAGGVPAYWFCFLPSLSLDIAVLPAAQCLFLLFCLGSTFIFLSVPAHHWAIPLRLQVSFVPILLFVWQYYVTVCRLSVRESINIIFRC